MTVTSGLGPRLTGGRDSSAVRVVALLRITAMLSVAGIGSFTADLHGHVAHLLLVLGLVGVPWATVVFFCADRPDNRIALYGGPIGDLLTLFAVQALLPNAVESALPGYLVLVAFTVYTAGRSAATLVAAAAIGLSTIAYDVAPGEPSLHPSITIAFLVGAMALLLLLERTTVLQEKATATSAAWQSRAETILSHVGDAVLVTDDAGRMLQCNPAAERLIGRSSEDAAGSACAHVLNLRFGEREMDCSTGCALIRAQREGMADARDLWRLDATGRRQPLLAEAAEVTSAAGETEVVHSLRDITRLKQAEEAKTLFLATASHELKTPLTVISGFASTLLRYPNLDDDQRKAALDAIWSRSLELTRIVERLLLSSRIEAGHLDVENEPLEVSPLVRERARSSAAAMARTIELTIADDLPLAVGNAQALATVVDHLLDNAIKYSPSGEPIEVGVAALDHTVDITITDHGIGMDPEQTRHCFERFWQAESTDVRRFGGTGIGLYIVQSLVDAMRASISVRSGIGEGTTFTVQLRRADAVPQQLAPGVGEVTSIREFMRQIGVPERTRR